MFEEEESRVRVLHVGAEVPPAEAPPLPALGPRDLPLPHPRARYGSLEALDGGLPRRRFATAAALAGQSFVVTLHYMGYSAREEFFYCDSGVVVCCVVGDRGDAAPFDCVLYVPLDDLAAGAGGAAQAPARRRDKRTFRARVRLDHARDDQAPQSGTDEEAEE